MKLLNEFQFEAINTYEVLGSNCFTKGGAILTFLFLMLGFAFPPQRIDSPEYQVKAVFLFNFAQFVEWPAATFPEAKSPIIIGVLGTDPFGSYLDETVQGEEIEGHPLVIQRFDNVSDIKNCHILFIHSSIVPRLDYVLKGLKGRNILTVSDGDNFTKQGGMVKFFTANNKIKLRINLDAVKAEDLTISSKLLRLAEIVGSNKNQ